MRLNDIVRTMTGRRKFDHVSPLYKSLSLLKLRDSYKLELANFMYQLSFNKLPKIIESAFPKIENIHDHNSRRTQNTNFFYLECLKMLQKINCRLKESNFGNQYVSSVAKRTLSVREVWGSIPGPVKSAQCRQRLATVATLLRSCVAQAPSRGDGPRNSLHASA